MFLWRSLTPTAIASAAAALTRAKQAEQLAGAPGGAPADKPAAGIAPDGIAKN